MPVFLRRREYTEKQIDYEHYKLSIREIVKYFSLILIIDIVLSYVFYKSIVSVLIILLPIYFYFKLISKYLIEKRRNDLTFQFKEFCLSLCSQLIAGYSIENAISETYKEMVQLYGKNAYICLELKLIISKLKISVTIERCFEELAKRCKVEEIILFSEIIKIAKRTGGDIIEIVRESADSISQKIEVEREIKIIINSKKQEQLIMNFIPLIMIIYANITSPDMMAILYSDIVGRIIMTICLGLYILAVYLGNKFSNIKM